MVTAADPSGARASFAGRGSQISMAAMGDTGTRGRAASSRRSPRTRPRSRPAARTRPGRRVPTCRTVVQRRPALRLPVGHVDGGAAGGRRRGAGARGEPALRASRGGAADEADGDPRRRRRGWTTELGWGILNAGAAVQRAVRARGATPSPPKTSRRGGRRRSVRPVGSRCGGGGATWRRPAWPRPASTSYSVYERRGKRYKLIADHDANAIPPPRAARQALLVLRARPGSGRATSSPRAAPAS